MKRLITKRNAFTLVELLIVIALIAILSVAVLATINPVEQANKARDASFKNDTAEVLNAYERYYASQNLYPWNYSGDGLYGAIPNYSVISGTNGIAFNSLDPRFGILAADGLVTTSELIRTSELKGAFGGKVPFTTPLIPQDTMYIFNNGSTYVCYCPKAKANRMADLKCLKNITAKDHAVVSSTPATLDDAGKVGCAAPNTSQMLLPTFCTIDDTSSAYANLRCVPEGKIQSI